MSTAMRIVKSPLARVVLLMTVAAVLLLLERELDILDLMSVEKTS
jgi:hypothetical protein